MGLDNHINIKRILLIKTRYVRIKLNRRGESSLSHTICLLEGHSFGGHNTLSAGRQWQDRDPSSWCDGRLTHQGGGWRESVPPLFPERKPGWTSHRTRDLPPRPPERSPPTLTSSSPAGRSASRPSRRAVAIPRSESRARTARREKASPEMSVPLSPVSSVTLVLPSDAGPDPRNPWPP